MPVPVGRGYCSGTSFVFLDKFMVFGSGGTDGDFITLDECFIFNIRTKEYTQKASMLTYREEHGLIQFYDCLYAFGGFDDGETIRKAEMYDISSDTWTKIPSMPRGGQSVSCARSYTQIFITSIDFYLYYYSPDTQVYGTLPCY